MNNLTARLASLLEVFPVASAVFVLYAIVGGVCTVTGSLTNGEYVDSLLKVGAGTGALGLARGVVKQANR